MFNNQAMMKMFEMAKTGGSPFYNKNILSSENQNDKHLLMCYFNERMFVKLGTNESEKDLDQ